jgi:hypothetical protein
MNRPSPDDKGFWNALVKITYWLMKPIDRLASSLPKGKVRPGMVVNGVADVRLLLG